MNVATSQTSTIVHRPLSIVHRLSFLKILFLLIILSTSFTSCQQADEEKIIGKWQNEQDWFQYEKDKTYSSGKDAVKMVDHFKYTIDSKTKELNMYTDDKSTTYYLIYEFKGDDTLAVRNALSKNKTMIEFYREKKNSE